MQTAQSDPYSMGESQDAPEIDTVPAKTFLDHRDDMVDEMMAQHQACKNQK